MNCARCSHPFTLHGRRGCGACRHGWASPLALAVEVLRVSVLLGKNKHETHEAIEAAFNQPHEPCKCKRFRKTAIEENSQ